MACRPPFITSHNYSLSETRFLLTLMSIPILPQSQFNGHIFVSNFHDVHDLCKPPSVVLILPTHFTTSGITTCNLSHKRAACSRALSTVWLRFCSVTHVGRKQRRRRCLRQDLTFALFSFAHHPTLSSLDDYACHVKCSALWNYVCISNFYVKLWTRINRNTKLDWRHF